MQIFQSTLPTRGSDGKWFESADTIKISIHAPHEGERLMSISPSTICATYFNPRSPRGGATVYTDVSHFALGISIHAPHEGERRSLCGGCLPYGAFQSTLPTRGSDLAFPRVGHCPVKISIHAPHEGERRASNVDRSAAWRFQSTLPTRGSDADVPPDWDISFMDFNPRSPRGGATLYQTKYSQIRVYFNPRSPRGGATRLVARVAPA